MKKEIKNCWNFAYLGSNMRSDGEHKADVKIVDRVRVHIIVLGIDTGVL